MQVNGYKRLGSNPTGYASLPVISVLFKNKGGEKQAEK